MTLKPIARRDALLRFPGLAAQCWLEQQALRANADPVQAGDEVYLSAADDEPTLLDQAAADRFNQDEAALIDGLCDPFDSPPSSQLQDTQTLVIEPNTQSFEGTINVIGDLLTRLARAMHWDHLAVLSMTAAPILVQENDYPPVRDADRVLLAAGLSRTHADGLTGPAAAFAEIMAPLLWIARCNASAPLIVLGAEGADHALVLCKYGNVHIESPQSSDHAALQSAVLQTGFTIPPDGLCGRSPSTGGVIDGRHLDLS